jgi:hypothetical protein
MRRMLCALALFMATLFASLGFAAEFVWTGMRNPCKQSAADGLDSSQLGKKIGAFITLADKSEWAQVVFNVNNRFPESKPWVTWAVGAVRDATSLTDAQHEEYLDHMDALGVVVFLELSPNRGDDVPALIDAWLAKLKHHPCVKGLGVDLEFYQPADDAMAQEWDEQIKRINPDYRLLLKHWEQRFMPPSYRGRGDLIFINTSSEATPDALNEEFAEWTRHFAPSAVAFQIGYPSDEDGMDGNSAKGWWTFDDPIRDWGRALLAKIGETDQEIGLLWVCVKSGKTYNADWDLTRGAKVPEPASR